MTDMRRLNLRSTAFHEAGHAVVAVLKGIGFSKVWILRRKENVHLPRNVVLGQVTRITPVNKPEFSGKVDEAKVEAVLALAGPIAECLAYPTPMLQPDWELNKDDFTEARSILRYATTPFTIIDNNGVFTEADLKRTETDVDRLLEECHQTASRTVIDNRLMINRVANVLQTSWELTQQAVTDLCF